jgi:hypothetical protein
MQLSRSIYQAVQQAGYVIEPDDDDPRKFSFYKTGTGESSDLYGSHSEAVLAAFAYMRKDVKHAEKKEAATVFTLASPVDAEGDDDVDMSLPDAGNSAQYENVA